MSFIKLSSRIINPGYISSIILQENKYVIKMLHVDITGFNLFGSGLIQSNGDIITICQKKDPKDYDTVRHWISQVIK